MTGLRVNTAKTKVMSWNNFAGRKVQVDGEELEGVSKFVCLGVQRFSCSVIWMGRETWRMAKRDATKLNVFLHKSLRRLMKIYWPMKLLNDSDPKRG